MEGVHKLVGHPHDYDIESITQDPSGQSTPVSVACDHGT